jgi:hypothetical protein
MIESAYQQFSLFQKCITAGRVDCLKRELNASKKLLYSSSSEREVTWFSFFI